jgi:hypothetical protein
VKAVAPATVFTLLTQQIAAAFVVSLQWDANAEVDIDHYNLKWGFVPAQEDHVVDAGNSTTIVVDEPWSVGMTIYFVCTAVNVVDVESGPSNEVSYTVPHGRPKPPTNLMIIDVSK